VTDMTRRAAITATAALGATLLAATDANAYDPSTARANAIGATEAGWIEATAPTWDDEASRWNLREVEARLTALALDHRDAIAALTPPPTRSIKIMCVGDSITAGYGSTDGHGYQTWLTTLLHRRGIHPNITTIAQPGGTLRQVTPLAIAALPTAQPDIVLIHLGANDAAQGDTTDFQNRYGTLIDQILASNPNVKVCAARIGYMQNAAWAAIQVTLNAAVAAAVAARPAARVVAADHTTTPARWTTDTVHPGDAAYLLTAQTWIAAIGGWLPA
jgi:lysophospholipase L1-like esterase